MSDAWSNRAATFDTYVNAARVMFNALTISMGLDQVTTVATFDLVDQPTIPAAGDPVQIDWVNLATDRATTQFAGRIYAVDAESFPHRVGIVAQGPLGVLTTCLRQRSDGDLDLTGMTDGEAVEAILTYCGVAYDPADIDDAGYELGEREAVRWHADGQTAAATITDELDRVFASKILDIGNGRVIRGFYDLASEATSGVRNYVRGADSRLFANRKAAGEITAIQNQWQVTGPTIDCGGGGDSSTCQCTPLANGHTDNTILETWTGVDHARAALQTFQSDLIQDEALAAAVATRLMEWHNRLPIELATEVQSEPQLYPCRTVTVRDNTYGIDLPTATAFMISRVEVRPDSTSLTLIGGPPGSVGTITSSVEELCNESEDTQDWPGDYVDPGFSDFPDLGDGVFTPFPEADWGDFPAPEVPNTEDRFIDCTETDGMAGGAAGLMGYLTYPSVGGSLTDLNWRVSAGAAGLAFHVPSIGADIDEIVKWGAGTATLVLNLTNPIASKNIGNDETFGTGPIIVLSFDAWFGEDGAGLVIATVPDTGTGGTVQLTADPGFEIVGTGFFGSLLSTEASSYRKSGLAAEHECTHISLSCDDGGARLDGGYPTGSWRPISVALDFAQFPMRIDLGGDGAGYKEDVVCWGPSCEFPIVPDPCVHTSHTLEVRLLGGGGTGALDPHLKIRGLTIGSATCVENPDYIPGGIEDGS